MGNRNVRNSKITSPLALVSFLPDNPNLVSRVVVAIETLDQNDNAPELDRQYTTSVCDSSAPGQVSFCHRSPDIPFHLRLFFAFDPFFFLTSGE